MILLINPPVFENGRHILNNMQEPFSLLQLGGVLEKSGYEVKIIDYNVVPFNEQRLKEIIQKGKILFIGMTMLAIHTHAIKRLIPIIRQVYSGRIVVGGVQASISPHEVLRYGADIVVKGEGDKTIEELARTIYENRELREVRGISYLDGGRIYDNTDRELIRDLDILPFPARHLVKMDAYRWRYWGIRVWGIMAGRGCPFRCYYCSKLFGDKVRIRSPERIIEEIEFLRKKYGVRGFLFHDDTFTLRYDWINRFLDLLIEKRLDIRFRCHTRINTATPGLLKKLYQAGCRGVDFGIETGDPYLNKIIRKGINLKKVKEVVEWARRANLEVMGNFMIGFPDDTHATIRNNILFAASIPFSFINVSIVTPYPGTALYNSLSRGEKDALDFSRFRQSAPEFFLQSFREYENIYTIPNRNLTRRDILHYYQLMPIYFFTRSSVREIFNIIPGGIKFMYLWGIRRQSFKESLASTFPSLRSMLLAIVRSVRRKRGLEKFSYLYRLIKITVLGRDYLNMERSVFE